MLKLKAGHDVLLSRLNRLDRCEPSSRVSGAVLLTRKLPGKLAPKLDLGIVVRQTSKQQMRLISSRLDAHAVSLHYDLSEVNPASTVVAMASETLSDAVAARVRGARHARRWQASDLAERCAELGHPELTTAVIQNIENGRRDKDGRRRRYITVDELHALADALGCSPVELLGAMPSMPGATADQLDQLATAFRAAADHARAQEKESDD